MPVLMKFPEALQVGQTITVKGIFSPNGDRLVLLKFMFKKVVYINKPIPFLQPTFQPPK